MIGPLGRWSGSLAGSCVPCLRSSSVGSRSPSVGLRCSALGLLESFLGLLGCSATCWLLDPSLCLLGSPILGKIGYLVLNWVLVVVVEVQD